MAGGYVSFKGGACGLLFNRAEWAGVVRKHESKRAMLGMANAWLTLAEQHLKNCETVLVYETPPLVDEPPKPSPVSDPPSVGEPPPL